jgi:hypothetical protein
MLGGHQQANDATGRSWEPRSVGVEPENDVRLIAGLDLGKRGDPTAITAIEATRPRGWKPASVYDQYPATEPQRGPRPKGRRMSGWRYEIVKIIRFDLNTDYPDINDVVCKLWLLPPLAGTWLAVDWTGVGEAVVDYLNRDLREALPCPRCAKLQGVREDGRPVVVDPACRLCQAKVEGSMQAQGILKPKCQVRPIRITFGTGFSESGAGYNVAKSELASVLSVLFQPTTCLACGGAAPRRDGCAACGGAGKAGRIKLADPAMPWGDKMVQEAHTFSVKVTAKGNNTYEALREADHDDLVLSLAMPLFLHESCNKEFWYR